MEHLDNETLIKRSTHARRNLIVLATLASLVAIGLFAAAAFVKGGLAPLLMPSSGIAILAAGYWFLAVAAGRGNPTSVGIVVVASVASIAISMIASAVVAAMNGTSFRPNIAGCIIPVLIIVALNRSRNVLLELKRRDLWNQVFGSAKPSNQLCVIGGVLAVTGFLIFNGGSFFVGMKAGQSQNAEVAHANAFVSLVQKEEKEFVNALQDFTESGDPAKIQLARTNVERLLGNIKTLQDKAGTSSPLYPMLDTYNQGIKQWQKGIVILASPNGDPQEAQKNFVLGDKIKTQALEAFDKRYSGKGR